jgi:hypothetical protein
VKVKIKNQKCFYALESRVFRHYADSMSLQKRRFAAALAYILLGVLCAAAQVQPAANTQAEAAYTKTIEKRAADVLMTLGLKEGPNRQKVHDILITHYRALRDWHDANGATLKKASGEQAQQIRASLKKLHDRFIAELSSVLSAEDVVKVKDKMTYNKVKVTFDSYCRNLPNLTEAQKEQVLAFLKQAREEAMDAGSSDEKSKIFRQYKGKINNYLLKEGYDTKQADKESEKPKSTAEPESAKP